MGSINCSVAKRQRKVNTDRTNWDVDAQANIEQVDETLNEKVRVNHYSSVAWRNEAVQHSAVFAAKALDEKQRQENQRIIGSMKSYLKDVIKIKVNRIIEVRLANQKGLAKADIRKALGYDEKTNTYSGNLPYVIENFEGTSEVNDNLIAWYSEIYNDNINEATGISYANEFFNNVFAHAKLGTIKFDNNDTFGEYELAVALDVNDDNDTTESEQGENPTDTDDSNAIAAFDHSGEHKDFMVGVNQDIKTYFNTLNKLKSSEKANNKWQLDKENLYGLVNTMDARACSSVLFHQGDFTDDQAMVASIKRIARQCAGFEAFMKFAEDLEKDADFRYKVYNNFAKRIMSKMETVVENKNGETNLANKRSNAITALSFEFRNTIKSTSVSINNYEMEDRFNKWSEKVTVQKKNTKEEQDAEKKRVEEILNILQTNPNNEQALQIVGELTELLQIYFPTIDRFAIANYLYNATDANGEIKVPANLSNLKNILNRTIAASKRTADTYNSLQYDIATEKNRKKKYALYKVDYVDKANYDEAQALAELLAPYSAVRVDLNSRNTEGKLSSDVMNNNFLTNFINTLQSSLNRKFKDAEGNITYAQDCPLQHFKEFKFKSTQYNLSNILVEKVENGRVVNRGLFRKDGNQYVPTEYATDLLKISKFNGATSFDNSKNTLYSKMSKNDYITTAFINFFAGEGSINGTPMANYFMRIPSDSSTQFVVTAPRYEIAQSGRNALRTPDGNINKEHPIFQQFKNAFLQELIDMGGAINTIFVTDENGVVTRVEKDGKHLLQFNPNYSNTPVGRLYKKYHYNGKEVVKNFGSTTAKEELTGNVFKSNRLVIVKEDGTEVNYGQQFIEQFVDFLYGGAIDTNTNESVKFIKENGRVVGVNLDAQSQEFKNALDDMIGRFIADYSREAINRIQSSKGFIKDSMKSLIGEDKDNKEFNRKVSEFILNTHLMYINFDDLFEGNSKFYGSAQDFLKRAKEVQGSGVPYGIVNYNNDFSITQKSEKKGALLNEQSIIDRIGNIKQYDSFRSVTIVNTVRTPIECEYKKPDGSGKDGILVKTLAANFAKQGGRKAPNEKDTQRARDMMAGFANAKVNDAQSYITFEEWVRRIAARGQLMKHLPLIEKIQKGETLTDTEKDAFVQVQKNFYYDQYYDEQTGIIVPRQIKNAEFVLVPQFIEGTQLKQIYDLMKKHDIDQLNTEETSKAGKHNVLTLWDNDGNLTEENIADFDAKADGAAEYFNYNNLYTQQETPQHVNAENKAGIQIMKKIIDNIPTGHKLYPIKQKFMTLYSANVQAAFQDLANELNIETDSNGYPVLDDNGQIKGLDYKKLYDLFREEAERLGVDSNLSDYFTLEDDVIEGVAQTLMPNFFSNVSNRVESVAQALFNSRITRQKLPGFHGAQVTSIGFKKDNIQTNDALRYHSKLNENGKEEYAPYIEVMLPKSNFGLSGYDNTTALQMIQEAGVDELIGYRIPTEGKQSVAVMKVVGFTDDAQGSTIIVPDGWVPQTGSDFDIDSIYGIQFHFYVGKDGKIHRAEYNEDKLQAYKNYVFKHLSDDELNAIKDNSTITAEDVADGMTVADANAEFMTDLKHYAKLHNLETWEDYQKKDIALINSKEARDNEILKCMMTILKDDSSMEENLGRSNFDDISHKPDKDNGDEGGAIQKMMSPTARLKRERRSPYNFFDQADYQDDAMSGAKLKGFSVTRDNLCSVCNTIRPIASTDAYTMLYDATKYDIEELKESFGEQNVNLSNDKKYIQVRHKTFGWTRNNKNIAGRILTSYSSETTAHILDAIKEGAAPNVNDLTFAVYKTFVDLGSDYDTAIGFMAQPAVTRIVEAYNKNKSIFTGYNTNPLQQAIRSLARDLGIKLTDKKGKGISLNKLIEEINAKPELAAAFKQIFGVDLHIGKVKGNEIEFENFALPAYLLKDRIDESGIFASSPVEESITKEVSKEVINQAINGSKNELDFAKGVIEKIKYKEHWGRKITDEDRKDLVEMQKRADKYSKLLEAYRQGKAHIEIIQWNVGQIVLNDEKEEVISKDIMKSAFDLGILLKYSQFANFSQRIGDVARVTNPDKFGAKKNIFETNKVFEDIKELIDKGDMPLLVNAGTDAEGNRQIISILEAIYPGIGDGNVDTFMRATPERASLYPPLYAFLKYATAPSIIINRTLFETQTDEFIAAVNSLEKVLGFGSKLTEKQYTDFQKYMLGEIYSEIPFIKHPVVFDQSSDTFDIDVNVNKQNEIGRIYGFNRSSGFSAPIRRQTVKSIDEVRDAVNSKKTIIGKLNELKRILPKEVLDTVSFDESEYSIEELVSANLAGIKFTQESIKQELGIRANKDLIKLSNSISGSGNSIIKAAENIAREINNPFGQGIELERTDCEEVRNIIINLLSSSQSYDELIHLHEQIAINTLLSNYAEYVERTKTYTTEEKKFNVKSIYKPTVKELEVWRELSPAQKVLWIQQNAKNPGIFGLFKVDLRNNNRDGSQTIEFSEDSVNIEDAYSMFNNAFYSENPLIRYAAADLIKYAFVVEGFQMSQHAVNKVIRNTPLMQSIETGGTGVVSYMRDAVRNIQDSINIDKVIENYVKSHDIQGLPKVNIDDFNPRNLNDEKNKKVIKEQHADGLIVEREVDIPTGVLMIQINDDNLSTLIENNILRIDEYGDYNCCPYFKTTGRKGKTYKFKIVDGIGYAYPLNKLQPNEHSDWSTNLDNSSEPSAEYFEAIIKGEIDTSRKGDFMSPVTYKVNRVSDFNVNELKDNTVNKINNASSEILKGNVYYLWSPELSTKLPGRGDMTVQEVNGIIYDIIKVENLNVQKKYLGENSDITLQSKDIAYNDLINNPNYGLKAMGFKKPSRDVFMVRVHKQADAVITPEELMSDTTEDLGSLSIDAIFTNASQGDTIAKEAQGLLQFRNSTQGRDIPVTSDSLFVISNYLTRVVDKINDQLKNFETEDDRHFKVTDPELINYIRNNPAERRRYLKVLLDARKIKRQFEAYSAFDTTSSDPELKRYLDNIKKKVVELDEALTSNGLELFAKDYLKGVSTNPLVQQDIITLLDGFYGSGMIEAMINDTQEMSNPLIQIITKEVMADIRAKEMQAEERIKDFENTWDRIEKEAKAAGMSINQDNVVDKTGKLIQPYKDSFIDDYRALKQNIESIKNNLRSDGTVDYEALNRAELALDKWLNDNVELPLRGDEKDEFGLKTIKSFYTKKIELDQMMIDNAPKLFARYKELQAKRKDIVSHLNSSNSDPRWEAELKDVDIEIKSLTTSLRFDEANNAWVKKSDEDIHNAELLSKYKKEIKELYDEYYDKEENAGFREELDINLRIVKEAERRDKYGIPQASAEELRNNERYQRAATWLRKNAIFSPDPETYEKVNEAFKVLGNGTRESNTSKILKLVATTSSAYDIKGKVDGTKLTAEQQKNLNIAQQKEYNDRVNVNAMAVSLINSAGENDEIYTKEFYKLIYKEGYAKSEEYKAKVKEINDILAKHYGNSRTINFVDMTADELQKLANLYRELRDIREDIEFAWSSRYAKLHSEDVDYVINEENFDIAKNAAQLAGVDMNLWEAVNTEFVTDESGKKVRVPNKLIYGRAVPSETARAKKKKNSAASLYIDEAKTEAFKTIRGYMVSEPSEYYYEEYARRRKEGVDADGRTFEEWYADNHVYNPYSRTMIPNKAWMVSRLNDNNEGTWAPGFTQSHSVPKPEYKNPNHKDGISLGVNFKDKDGRYKNDVAQNQYEKELQDEISKLLISLAHVESAKRFFESGYMPIMSKDEEHDMRFYLKEAAKGVGWIEDVNTGKDLDENINYANDYIPSMPMTTKLQDMKGKDLDENIKQMIIFLLCL